MNLRFATVAMAVALWTSVALASPQRDVTALQSLNAVGAQGDGVQLVEVRGTRGSPQPADWTFFFSDPSARGGVREFVVSGREVTSVRTPLRGFGGLASEPAIARAELNVDSDRAFQLANRAAVSQRISFHWVDYTLRMEEVRGPVWMLRLVDHMGVPVGSIKISATDGGIIAPLKAEGTNVSRIESPAPSKPVGGVIGDVRDFGVVLGRSVSNSVLHGVGSVEEFLTGERTIGPSNEDDE